MEGKNTSMQPLFDLFSFMTLTRTLEFIFKNAPYNLMTFSIKTLSHSVTFPFEIKNDIVISVNCIFITKEFISNKRLRWKKYYRFN